MPSPPEKVGAPSKLPLAVTMGEPAGIGGELTLKAWVNTHSSGNPFFVIDDPTRLSRLAGQIGQTVPVREIGGPSEAGRAFQDALPVLAVKVPAASVPGKPDPANSKAVTSAIETAVRLALSGEVAGLVTNPIQKATLYEAGFPHPGHTEFLADLAGLASPPVMMLACEELRAVPITVHVSLRDAVADLTTEDIVTKARITARALERDFGIAAPRLAVAGLNPHAGEDGTLGVEDEQIIAPAVRALQADGIDAWGPVPADTLFSPQSRKTYDAAICMYHDQALIPVKTLDFEGGVNITLGLPFVRTSPDHGTALDIAGTGKASERSLLAALSTAREIADHRGRAARVTG